MALQGQSNLDIVKTLNSEGISTSNGKRWLKTTVHAMLTNEAYTGALVSGATPGTTRRRCGWRTPFPPSLPGRSSSASPG